MIIDAENRFSNAQAITASAASTNIIDLGVAQRRLGTGEPIYVFVGVVADFTDGGSDSTVTVELEQDDNEAFASGTVVQSFGTFGALSAAGARLVGHVYPDVVTERYIRLKYTVANGNLTTGSLTAALVKDIDAQFAHLDAITIS